MTANVLPGTGAPRIVMVLPAYLPESFGGAPQQTRRLAHALARRGAAVTLLAPRLARGTPSQEREGPRIWADGTATPSCGGAVASTPGCGETGVTTT
jgi:hypothetical protein